jgi:branched-chain amino acid transport system permease protein
MDMINLAHGSLYMIGAYLAAWLGGAPARSCSRVLGAMLLTALFGMAARAAAALAVQRDHLSQVLATLR